MLDKLQNDRRKEYRSSIIYLCLLLYICILGRDYYGGKAAPAAPAPAPEPAPEPAPAAPAASAAPVYLT